MAKPRFVPADHAAFTHLPVRLVTVDDGGSQVAVHIAGRLRSDRPTLLCLAGYHRNMSDFSEFLGHFRQLARSNWTVALIDLRGRGRSSDRAAKDAYGSPSDARDVAAVADALGVESAIVLGQGYGGQVAMVLATLRPMLIAGAILIDAGPLNDPRGLVRLRSNLSNIAGLRGPSALKKMFRQMLSSDYPDLDESDLDRLASRTHYLDNAGAAQPLFDSHLVTMLDGFSLDDVLEPQWQLFSAMGGSPLMLMRTQLTDQLTERTFEEMLQRRRDAQGLIIVGEGSPARLDHADEVGSIAGFMEQFAPRERNRAPKR